MPPLLPGSIPITYCLNPLKRVNSILTLSFSSTNLPLALSQSPQTGQFNSYGAIGFKNVRVDGSESQSPQTGQFNSYYKSLNFDFEEYIKSQSPQTGQFNSYGIAV